MLTETQILILSIALGLLVILFLIVIMIKKRRPKVDVLSVPNETIIRLHQALGGSENVLDVSIEHQRLKVTVSDLKQIDQNALKDLGIAAALKGKSLTLLITSHVKDYYVYLSTHKKED